MGIRDNDRELVRLEWQTRVEGLRRGNCGKNPEGIDNPVDEGLKNVSPLPEGIYTLGTPVEHSQLGAFAIPLIPDPANNMLGRGGFYLHGDTVQYQAASEGRAMPVNELMMA